MSPQVRFICRSCDEWHVCVPGWGWPFPMDYLDVPEAQRAERCYLSEDLCVVDHSRFFVCGCLELPVQGYPDILSVRAWAAISETDFFEYQDLIGVLERSHCGPYAGKLSAPFPTYSKTEGLALSVRINNDRIRPTLLVEDREHPLGIEQKAGISMERLQSIYTYLEARGVGQRAQRAEQK